jgi:hypothetical protein
VIDSVLCPTIDIATDRGTPARSKVRTADRRVVNLRPFVLGKLAPEDRLDIRCELERPASPFFVVCASILYARLRDVRSLHSVVPLCRKTGDSLPRKGLVGN